MTRVTFLAGEGKGRDFSLHHHIQTGSGPHPASHPMDTGGSFPGIKQPEHDAGNSSPSNATVMNAWRYISTYPYVFMAWVFN
jgi:hypothetical protein